MVAVGDTVILNQRAQHLLAPAVDAGADFVKTSTGFHPSGGASAHAVRLMRECVGPNLGVKASGGIRDAAARLNGWNPRRRWTPC